LTPSPEAHLLPEEAPLTVALAHTYRLPEVECLPEDIPVQHALPDQLSSADELAGYETVELWTSLAGLLMRRGLASKSIVRSLRWHDQAQAVALKASELHDALWQSTKERAGL
jgi:hypothetical protein